MTPEQEMLLTDLTRHLEAAYEGREALVHARLLTGRALLRLADVGDLGLSASDEERMDTLYGLVRWGLLVFPLLRVDPRVFAAERRARRPVPVLRPEWRD